MSYFPTRCFICQELLFSMPEFIEHQKHHLQPPIPPFMPPFMLPVMPPFMLPVMNMPPLVPPPLPPVMPLPAPMPSHVGPDKNHDCPNCGKPFPSKSKLERHQTVHTGARPYPCDKCDCAYTQKGSLEFHQLRKHSKT